MNVSRRRAWWWLKRVAVCLLLGVVTTVGVAVYGACSVKRARPVMTWAWSNQTLCMSNDCTLLTERMWSNNVSLEDAERDVEFFLEWYSTIHRRSTPITSSTPLRPPPPPPPPSRFRVDRLETMLSARRPLSDNHYSRYERLYGWPMRCLWYWQAENGRVKGAVVLQKSGTFSPNPFLIAKFGIPYLPIWSGLVVNTVLYSAAWAALLRVLLAVINQAYRCRQRSIQRRRLRRGRCPLCNYDLAGDMPSGCPECGWNRGVTGAR